MRTRFAPTPSGFLHIGNAYSFAVTWALAKRLGGKIMLRIDDLDQRRARPEFVLDIFETLSFLGFDYDDGPTTLDDLTHTFSQHYRLPFYHAYLERLKQLDALYACACSRSQAGGTSGCASNCRSKKLPLDTKETAWRVIVPTDKRVIVNDKLSGETEVDLSMVMPDFVVRGKDGMPSYQLASLVDDVTMNIDFIVRGNDLLHSTAAQLYLSELLNTPAFSNASFIHHKLITGLDGAKLSKSHQSLSIAAMRKAGASSSDIWRSTSKACGIKKLSTNPAEFLEQFDEAMVQQNGSLETQSVN